MRAGALAVVILSCSLLPACRSPDSAPNLLSATDFAPEQADVGDRLELLGSGFPEGKPATLTFRGSLHRPGREPLRDVEIVAPATSSSQNRITLVMSEQLYGEFVGRGRSAAHTTFRGEVRGAFAPKNQGAPPVSGAVDDVVLDLAPPTHDGAVVRESVSEGERLLDFAGVVVDPEHKPRVVVKALEPSSRAARAGIEPGDEIYEFDGVRVHGPEDLIPSGKRRTAQVLLRHGRLGEPAERLLDVDGFRSAAPRELASAAMLVGLAAAIVLLFAAPGGRVITWVERRAAHRLRDVYKKRTPFDQSRNVFSEVARSFSSALPRTSLGKSAARVVLYVTFLASMLWLSLLSFGRAIVVPELDLLLLFVASFTAVSSMALVLGGFGEGETWSLGRGLKNAALVASCQLPAVAGVACVLLMAGSLRLRDVVWSQGGAPWHWFAFQSPTLLLMFALFVASAVPEASRTSLEMPELDSDRQFPRESRHEAVRTLTMFAEWFSLLVASGLCAVLFLGGWQLPFVSPLTQQSSSALQVLGAALVIFKCWLVVGLVLLLRWTLPDVRVNQVVSFFVRFLVPASLFGVGSSLAWTYLLENRVVRDVQGGLGAVLFALAMFIVGYCIQRVASGLRRSSMQMSVNPWL